MRTGRVLLDNRQLLILTTVLCMVRLRLAKVASNILLEVLCRTIFCCLLACHCRPMQTSRLESVLVLVPAHTALASYCTYMTVTL